MIASWWRLLDYLDAVASHFKSSSWCTKLAVMSERRVKFIFLYHFFKLFIQAIMIPALIVLGIVLHQFSFWITKLIDSGVEEKKASTLYAKISFDLSTILISGLILICFPFLIGQLEIISHYKAEANRIKQNLKFAKNRRHKTNRKSKIKHTLTNQYSLLFFGIYIPKNKKDFSDWYWRSFGSQSLLFFGIGVLSIFISKMRPQSIWPNYLREYVFTLLMLNLLFLTIKSIFLQLTRERLSH